MSIPSKQIGWSQESNLLWNISKQLERLTGVTGSLSTGSTAPTLGVYTFTGTTFYDFGDVSITSGNYFQLDNVVYGPYNVYSSTGIASQPYITALTCNEDAIIAAALNGFPNIITASYPSLVYIQSGGIAININGLTSLTSFSAPLLKYIEGTINIITSTSINSINLNSLVRVGSITISNTALASISFPALKNIIGGLILSSNTVATSLSLPLLTSITSNISISTTPITSFLLPSIKTAGPITVTNNSSLTTVSLNTGLVFINGNISFSTCALNQASVDGILVRLAALDGTGGTVAYSSRTVTLNGGTNATPSATGLAAKAILVGRGCTVTNN